jgi:predicted aspartyl protease
LLKKALEENQKQIDAMKQSYESKLAEAKTQIQNVDSEKFLLNAKKLPHWSNILGTKKYPMFYFYINLR